MPHQVNPALVGAAGLISADVRAHLIFCLAGLALIGLVKCPRTTFQCSAGAQNVLEGITAALLRSELLDAVPTGAKAHAAAVQSGLKVLACAAADGHLDATAAALLRPAGGAADAACLLRPLRAWMADCLLAARPEARAPLLQGLLEGSGASAWDALAALAEDELALPKPDLKPGPAPLARAAAAALLASNRDEVQPAALQRCGALLRRVAAVATASEAERLVLAALAAGGARRVVAVAEVLRRASEAGGGGVAPVPPAWLCERLLRPLARTLDGPDWLARREAAAALHGIHARLWLLFPGAGSDALHGAAYVRLLRSLPRGGDKVLAILAAALGLADALDAAALLAAVRPVQVLALVLAPDTPQSAGC
ncbi:hypothetical protein WJX81_001738 [Elliptochloris bilobata]|uniref:HEAT repeat-containing protein 1 n=1 Tax=Elliptochloris bilobata TaxID=381761 RepID=A0AAW1QJV7_9CHLO